MDTSCNQAGNVSNNDDFWEEASIKLDIAIDEQEEEEYDNIVQCPEDVLKEIFKLEVDKKSREQFWKELFDKNDNVRIGIKIRNQKSEDKFWTVFFIAKIIRAKLQSEKEKPDTQSKKLDWVVDLLIKKGAFLISEDKPFRYLLLMLELAACTIGEQSLGFSQKAKEILLSVKDKGPNNGKSHAYNALIHYNQGLAKAHMGQHHDALREYDDALKEYKKARGHTNIPDVWSKYVYHPTILQKAEVLIKMQFSYNALITLDEIKDSSNGDPEPSSFFHIARKELLKAACYLELSDWNEFDSHWKTIDELKKNDNKNGKKYFKNSSVPTLNYLDAENPQKPSRHTPSILASSYNSLVLDRAEESLRKKVDEIIDGEDDSTVVNDLKIFVFLKEYMCWGCKDNRFERLTLKETIFDYIAILVGLVDKELEVRRGKFGKPGPVFQKVDELIRLLDEHNDLTKEIDPIEKPFLSPDSIENLQKISDLILKEWFEIECPTGKVSGEPKPLPKHFRKLLNFENRLIKKIITLEGEGRISLKGHELKNFSVRKSLLDVVSRSSSPKKLLQKLRDDLVCIHKCAPHGQSNSSKAIAKKLKECLKRSIAAINPHASIYGKVRNKEQFAEAKPREGAILVFSDYDKILSHESGLFEKHMQYRSIQPVPRNNPDCSVNYVGLRRWNSYTPALSFSVGGGHFVFLSDNKGRILRGITIDPGFDYIRNFFHQGFTLIDIDLILLTHGHPDHIRDFPAIVELLFENRKRTAGKREHKIYTVMSLGCYKKLQDYIVKDPFKRLFYDTIILDIDKNKKNYGDVSNPIRFSCNTERVRQIDTNKENLRSPLRLLVNGKKEQGGELIVEYFPAFHNDYSESDSYGFKLTFNGKKNCKNSEISIGFTGDCKWFPEYAINFKDCHIICSHMGSIVEPRKDRKLESYTYVGKAERLIREQNHPYLFGEILFIQDWKDALSNSLKSLVLISEFGEEMKGNIRSDLTKRINSALISDDCWIGLSDVTEQLDIGKKCIYYEKECSKSKGNLLTIPVDVGLRVSIPLAIGKNDMEYKNNELPGQIHCIVCDDFIEPKEIDYEIYGHEEAIFYICKTCKRSKSIDVRHTIYQKIHEAGRGLKIDEIS